VSGASHWVGGGAALTASAIWAVSTTLMKGAIVRHGARGMNLFRVSIALVLFWTSTLLVDGGAAWRAIATRDGQLLLLSGVIGLAVGDLFLFACLRRLGAQPAIAMNQLSPVWSALLGFALGSEVLHGRELLGIALVIGGVLLVIFGRDARGAPGSAALGSESAAAEHPASGRPLALALGIGSSLCNAVAGMMTHHSIASVGALPGSTLRMSGAAVVLLLLSFSGRRTRSDFAPLRALPTMRRELVAVLIATYLGIFLQQQAYAGLDASIALCLLSTTPLFLLPLAVGILRERYRWYAWLGTLIATSGVPLLLLG